MKDHVDLIHTFRQAHYDVTAYDTSYTEMVDDSSFSPKIREFQVYWDGWRAQHFILDGLAPFLASLG